MNNKGFTLVEILVAVLIVAILVTMAAPMYDKAIEKSRLAEARVTAKKLFDAKARLMDSMDLDTYNSANFGFENLDFALNCKNASSGAHRLTCETKDFKFVINPSGTNVSRGICAVRLGGGDTAGTNFLYMGEEAVNDDSKFQCNNGGASGGCEVYGMDSVGSSAWCS